jgi:hypothetical protein
MPWQSIYRETPIPKVKQGSCQAKHTGIGKPNYPAKQGMIPPQLALGFMAVINF